MRAYSKRKFTYNGQELEHGQVFEMIGARNDAKLISVGYCEELKKRVEVLDCTCGLSFVGEGFLRNHQRGDKHPKGTLVLSDA